ncbi:Uncharacterised protein [Mycobacterium tuberculosis]|uniref:Uncharacterized protein n=1 Tax=Mycobacterium tuberculosis TaxID=1773 RepID=A0A655JR47_MYCTX|nr:Uncharacterised protein [Mycobacterium tuberculosis]
MKASSLVLAPAVPAVATASPMAAAPTAVVNAAIMRGDNGDNMVKILRGRDFPG